MGEHPGRKTGTLKTILKNDERKVIMRLDDEELETIRAEI